MFASVFAVQYVRNSANVAVANDSNPTTRKTIMSKKKSTLDKMVSELKQQRDELKLQMHLASMEAKDEYNRLCGKCDELAEQYQPASSAVGETAENLLAALSLAAGELKVGFQRVRKALSESD